MNKELRRAELANRIKASFQHSDSSEELKLYTRIMTDVYYWQQEDGPTVTLDSISNNTQLSNKSDI